MITKETAVKIAFCHEQIENCQKIINDMAEVLKKDSEKQTPKLHNAFGEKVGLELGVPSGDSSYRIFGVNTELGIKIIQSHVEEKKKRLVELMAIATIELTAK